MQAIEGITPSMLWTFCVVLVGLMALIVLGHKVIEIVRKEHERKVQQRRLNGDDITEQIASKVMEKLQPKLDEQLKEIDKKLASDKETLSMHTSRLNAQENRIDQLDNDCKALCHGVFALLSHEVNGNSIDKLQRAQEAMKNYLIDGKYNEEDWT